MLKVPLVFLLIFNSLHLQVHSKTIIGNVTVSSDFIQDLFFDEIQTTRSKLADFDFEDIVNGAKCLLQLKQMKNNPLQSIQFIDSWGKIPSGILSGHWTDLGSYDQCVQTSTVLIPSHGITNGKYCFASFPLFTEKTKMIPDEDSLADTDGIEIFGRAVIPTTVSFQLGVCIPEICSPKLLTKTLQKATANVLYGRLAGANISNCSVARKPDFRAIDIIAIIFFSFIGVLMILSTLYDLATAHIQRKPVPLFLAFSVITNARKLFMINTEKSSNSITCLTGIRVFSMFWVIHCHNYGRYGYLNMINSLDLLKWSNNFASLGILMATVSVDSFFFLSGLLVAWVVLKELDRTKGKLNIGLMYLHRYIRLTPALAAVVLFYVTINKYIGSGPLRTPSEDCDESWWLTLLYVQNYVKSSFSCVAQAWYLACDTQLYIISPLILIPLWKWGKKFIPAIVLLTILSIGCVIATFFVEGYTNVGGLGNPLGSMPRTYGKAHTRCPPWLIGIIFGYIFHINRNKTIRMPRILQLIGWIISLGTMFFIVFGLHFFLDFPFNSSVGYAAANESLKRVFWTLALAWIVFTCHFGYGGLVNSILSHPFWQPIGRLTYCMYLVHLLVQEINYGIIRTDVYFSDYTMFLEFWKTIGLTLLSSIVLSLSFEAPILVIEKAIFGKRKPKSDSTDCIMPSTSQSKIV